MDAIKVGNFIRELRKKNKLTQKELANKYGITYQAVSKWERGINIPDICLLREMSKDFDVSLEDILDGEVKENKKEKIENPEKPKKEEKKEKEPRLIYPYVFGAVGFLFIAFLVVLLFWKTDNPVTGFSFKTLSTTCEEFKVTGAIAYDDKKSSINISNINYCGGDDDTVYDEISCELYEEKGKDKTLISKCSKDGEKQKLEDYLKEVDVKVDDYEQKCKSYTDNKLYLEIKASKDKKTIVYKIDLELNTNCPVEEKKDESKGSSKK